MAESEHPMDSVSESSLDSGVEQRLQIRDWNTIRAAGASVGSKTEVEVLELPRIPCMQLIPLFHRRSSSKQLY